MEKRYQFRHVNELIGLLVIGVLALVMAGIVFSEHSQQWFARKYTFGVQLPEEGALGLRRGDDVVILGTSVGLVDEIIVGEDGRMTARIKIRRDFERFVRADSTASIKKVFGLAGDSVVEVKRGHGAALPLHKPMIPCLVSEDSLSRIEKMAAELHAKLMPVIEKTGLGLEQWTKLGGEWRKHGDQWHKFIGGLDDLAAGVEAGQGTAGVLLTDTAMADEAQQVLLQTSATLSNLQAVVARLNAASQNIENGTARLPEITGAVADEAKDLPGLVNETQTTMRELERLIVAAQHNWFVRKFVNKTNPPPAPPLERPAQSLPKNRKSHE